MLIPNHLIRNLILSTLILFLLAACSTSVKHLSLKNSKMVKVIPVRSFYADRKAIGGYQLSPNGKYLAWRGVSGIRAAVFIKNLSSNKIRIIKKRVRSYRWAADSRHLFMFKDKAGNENYHIYYLDSFNPSKTWTNLTPFKGVRAHLQQVIKGKPNEILVSHNKRDSKSFDLYHYNLKNKNWTMVSKNTGQVAWWHTDDRGNLLARTSFLKSRHQLELKTKKKWKKVYAWKETESVSLGPFSKNRRFVYLLSNRNRDKKVLIKYDLKNRKSKVIAKNSSSDIRRVYYSDLSRAPIMATAMPGYQKRYYFKTHSGFRLDTEIKRLKFQSPYRLHISSSTTDESKVTYTIATDKNVKYYMFDVKTKSHHFLANAGINALSSLLASMKPFTYQARDGMKLHGYFTRPKIDTQRALPTVLLVHGGPWSRDVWAMYRTAQMLANRGYLVLQLNFRGSSGYGKRYMESAVGEFAGKMHTDLLDGLQWARAKGLADPKNVAIMGGSYGGYATLVGMTFTPDVFKCGVDIVGMSDLESLLKNVPSYWSPWMRKMYRFIGDPKKSKDLAIMKSKSPIYKVKNVKGPLLIIQGENDPRVKRAQSDRMVAELKKQGKKVKYMLIKNEGHGIRKWPNRIKVYRAVDNFLAKCLGGRAAGFDYYQLGGWLH